MKRYKLLFIPTIQGVEIINNDPIFTVAANVEEAERIGSSLKFAYEEVIAIPQL